MYLGIHKIRFTFSKPDLNIVFMFKVVDPEKSQVKMLGSKVEINLRKAEPGSWPTLELPVDKAVVKSDTDINDDKDEL